MKKTLRGFGIGLFVAAAIWTAYTEWLAPTTDEQVTLLEQQLHDSEKKVENLQQQLKIAQAESSTDENVDNDQDLTAEETSSNKEATKKETTNKETETAEAENIDVPVVTGTILIYENVSLYDIGKQAEDAGIIENGRELELYLYKPEFSRSIQKGQFELSSDMSLDEMARILTGKSTQ